MLKLENDESEKKAVNNEGGPHLGRSSKKDTSIRWTKLSHESYPDIRYYLDWMQHCLARVLTPFIGLCPYAFWPLWRRLWCNEDVSEPGSGFVTSWRLMLHYTIIIINYIRWPNTRINTGMGWTEDPGSIRHQTREHEGGMQGNSVSYFYAKNRRPNFTKSYTDTSDVRKSSEATKPYQRFHNRAHYLPPSQSLMAASSSYFTVRG